MPAIAMTASPYPPLNVQVRTWLSLLGATDDLLQQLVPAVRKGVATAPPWPFDDPMSLYKDNPDREWAWLRGIWAGRSKASDTFWRLYFVVVVDDEPVGTQDLIGTNFSTFGASVADLTGSTKSTHLDVCCGVTRRAQVCRLAHSQTPRECAIPNQRAPI